MLMFKTQFMFKVNKITLTELMQGLFCVRTHYNLKNAIILLFQI